MSDRLVLPKRVALGRPPSLCLLRRRTLRVSCLKPLRVAFVRRLLRYYGAVRLPTPVHRRLTPVGFTARTFSPTRRPDVGPPSSCTESLHACMGSSTARGPAASRASDAAGVAFRFREQRRHPGLRRLSRLNTRPARTPANTCEISLRTRRHSSGPVRVATALPYGSLIHYSPSVTGASPRNSRNSQNSPELLRPQNYLHHYSCFWFFQGATSCSELIISEGAKCQLILADLSSLTYIVKVRSSPSMPSGGLVSSK